MASSGPVCYEVEVTVDASAAGDYAEWLPGHIAQVLSCPGFMRAEWLEAGAGAGAARWSIRYTVRDVDALEAYLSGPAASLRADADARFGGHFTAQRRVLAIRATFDAD